MNKTEFLNQCNLINKGELELKEFIDNNIVKNYMGILTRDTICEQIVDSVNSYVEEPKNMDAIFSKETFFIRTYEKIKVLSLIGYYFDVMFLNPTDEEYDTVLKTGILKTIDETTNGEFKNTVDYIDKVTGVFCYSAISKLTDIIKSFEAFSDSVDKVDINNLEKLLVGFQGETKALKK